MTKHIASKEAYQGTVLASGTLLPLPPLAIEGLAEFEGRFDGLYLRASTIKNTPPSHFRSYTTFDHSFLKTPKDLI